MSDSAAYRAQSAPDEVQGDLAPQIALRAGEERRDVPLCAIQGCARPVPAHRGGKPARYCSPEHRRLAWERAHPGKRGWQAALPGESRVERAFAAWIETPEGQYVEREVTRLALEDKAAGDRRGEMNLYLALVRRSSRGLARDRAGFRCNNSFRSLLARKVMGEVPELGGFFETRPLRGRA